MEKAMRIGTRCLVAANVDGARISRLAVLFPLILASCGDQSPRAYQSAPTAARFEQLPLAFTPALARSAAPASSDQRIIRSGDISVQVDNVELAARRADSIAQQRGGLVADMRVAQDDRGKRSANLVINIPADRFRETLPLLKALGAVRSEAITQQDVGKAYADLETRLSVKEEMAVRLRRLLADRTGRLSDVLEVEREISRVVTEIEQMKGERRYYDRRIALSTINLTLFEAGATRPNSRLSIADAFRQSLEVFSTSVAWLVYFVTFLAPWLVLASIVWWLVRFIRTRRRAV
jgi:hypothetical protein